MALSTIPNNMQAALTLAELPTLTSAQIPAGTPVQKTHASYNSEFIYSGTSWSTFFTANFTPKFADSHIYIEASVNAGKRASGECQFNHRILRNGSVLSAAQHLNQNFVSNYDVFRLPDTANAAGHLFQTYGIIDDNHNTTSQITYTLQIISPTSSYPDVYFNYGGRSNSYMKFTEVVQ